MRIFVFLILSIVTLGCTNTKKSESLYFLYYGGNLKPSVKDMVLKNSSESYVDTTLMYVGKPLEYNIDNKNFKELLCLWKSNRFFDENKNEGILVIHYVDKKVMDKYIFTNKDEVKKLTHDVKKNVNDSVLSNNIVNWIKGIVRLRTRPDSAFYDKKQL